MRGYNIMSREHTVLIYYYPKANKVMCRVCAIGDSLFSPESTCVDIGKIHNTLNCPVVTRASSNDDNSAAVFLSCGKLELYRFDNTKHIPLTTVTQCNTLDTYCCMKKCDRCIIMGIRSELKDGS